MSAASLLYFVAALTGLFVYGALLIALVCWFTDRLPTSFRDERPMRYRVRLVDRLRRYSIVRFANKKYALYSADYAAARFLQRLSRRRLLNFDHGERWLRLLDYRDDFRRVQSDRPIAGLVWCLLYGSAEMQRLALWLLGKCGEKGVVPAIVRYQRHPDRAIRKEVARSLRRLNAWADLRLLAEHETDPLVLRFTVQPPPKPFQSRLEQFLGHAAEGV